jgi:hypothetical protein
MKRILNISKELREFLEEKHFLEKFRDNTYNSNCNGCKNRENTTVCNAFTWINTPEGFKFWEDVEIEFYDWYDEKVKQSI